MRILSISPYMPSEKTGHAGAQYIFRNLLSLSKDHSINSLFFANYNDSGFLKDLDAHNINYDYIMMERDHFSLKIFSNGLRAYIRSKKSHYPYIIEKYNQTKMQKLVKSTISSFDPDIVHIEYNYMHHYVQSKSNVPFVLTEHDISTKVKERIHKEIKSKASLLDYNNWNNIESRIINKFDAFITLTEEDKNYSKGWSVPKCFVIPPQFNIPKMNDLTSEQISLCFVGSYNRLPNIMALEEILSIFPQIKKKYPDLVLKIAGKLLSVELEEKIKSLNGAQYLGFVENIDGLIAGSTLFIAPIKVGAGLKMKIPHSLSVGTPVITTTVGAEGIPFGQKEGLWVEDSNELFIKKCIELLKSPQELNEIGKNSIDAVREYFSPDTINKKLEDVYSSVIEDFVG